MCANGKTRRDWGEGQKLRYIARLCFTDETILTMVKFSANKI